MNFIVGAYSTVLQNQRTWGRHWGFLYSVNLTENLIAVIRRLLQHTATRFVTVEEKTFNKRLIKRIIEMFKYTENIAPQRMSFESPTLKYLKQKHTRTE